jgi:filamentous hemagglutinin family protein
MKSNSQVRSSFVRPAGYFISLCALAVMAMGLPAEAGDILRAHYLSTTPGSSAAVYGATSASTVQATANANNILARTTNALQSVQALQAAARSLAQQSQTGNLGLNPNKPGQQLPVVPDGLVDNRSTGGAGGLIPDSNIQSNGVAYPVTTWVGASTPTQTTSNGQTLVNIQQTAQQAYLYWQTFNIGLHTTLNFDQSLGGSNQGEWVAFNRITDPSLNPSQILGSMKAQGQVYVINQNGIIFGGASQVNVHALVASSLPLNDNLAGNPVLNVTGNGLLNNPDEQFLFSQLPISGGAKGTPSFTPTAAPLPNGRDGDVVVQPGAIITAPSSSDNVGGKVALVGPNVTNAGTISTPDGQTILAAGNQVAFAAHASADPTLRGLDVFVGAVDQYSGVATNSGLIDAPYADVTITGKTVNQSGFINSLTSVSLNGRVDLLADYNAVSNTSYDATNNPNVPLFLFKSDGDVTLGEDSVTQILPDNSSTGVVGTNLALTSLVNIRGESIHLEQDAIILAPSASLPGGSSAVIPFSNTGVSAGASGGLTAGVTLNAGSWSFTNAGGTPQSSFANTSGQIYLDSGAEINVAGSTNVSASVTENIISVQLRGTELADSPLQRTGALRGQTVQVDILQNGVYNGQSWVGTPLANLTGYANLVDHTVGELTINGGTVTMAAGDSVVMQSGATIDVSGGWINYQGAMVQTTKLVSGGVIYDISQATPNMSYQILGGFTVNYAKWGVTDTWAALLVGGPYYEAGFIQGGNGGSISISAPGVALDGNLFGYTFAGQRQRLPSFAPTLSALSLSFQPQTPANNSLPLPSVVFEPGVTLPPAAPFALDNSGIPLPLSADRKATVVLSPDLVDVDGFGTLSVNIEGNISVPAGVTLTTPANGSISFTALNLDIEGKVTAPGGTLTFVVNDIAPSALAALFLSANKATPPPDPAKGNFILGPAASLSTAGLVVDDRPGSAAPESLPLSISGGAITIKTYSADLMAGSSINVSGGAAIGTTGKVTYGNAGAITIQAGQDPTVTSILGGQFVLDCTLQGYSGAQGGSLGLQARLIQIGGATTNPDTLLLPTGFFDQGGFASFSLVGIGEAIGGQYNNVIPAVWLTPGTVLSPAVWSFEALPSPSGLALMPVLLPAEARPPLSLSFSAAGVSDYYTGLLLARGDALIDAGASINAGPKGSVSISGNTVTVLGSIVARGGSISISGATSSLNLFSDNSQALPTVDIGPNARLSVAGTTLLNPYPVGPSLFPLGAGYFTGSELNGGSISIKGNIVAEAGAILNVSGASGVVDLPAADSMLGGSPDNSLKGFLYIPTRVDSNGGSITLSGGQELFTAATLLGNAGGPSATGGSLQISSGRYYSTNVTASLQSPDDVTITLSQNGVPFHYAGATAIGNAVLGANNSPLSSQGYFAANDFNGHGFDSLSLLGSVQFSGPVTISAKSSVQIASASKFGNGVILQADATVPNSSLTINAPYIAIGTFQGPVNPNNSGAAPLPFNYGDGSTPFALAPTYGTGNLTLNATELIDIGNLSLQGIGNATMNVSSGDLRGDGTLDIQGNLTLAAGQIYPPTAVTFNIFAYDHGGTPGTVTILGGSQRLLPLSAGGALNIYASNINQGGVLRAPIGSINLGWDGTGSVPVDPLTGGAIAVAATSQLNLLPGSVTSVSALDPATGQGLIIPYGIIVNGLSWVNPNATDITIAGNGANGQGLPLKSVTISAKNVAISSGASIDIGGGGDLYAYQFVSGLGGNTDILASNSSYAVIPGYQAVFAPYAPYSTIPDQNSSTNSLAGDLGYVNASLHVGDRVWLAASNGLPAGSYTLLPARYALLPGAFLVTPLSGTPPGSILNQDGSSFVSGYRFNANSSARTAQPLFSAFEVDPQSVVLARAEYDASYAGTFLAASAQSHNIAIPRLPIDAGQLVIEATASLSLQGSVRSQAPAGGLGGLVDISSPSNVPIYIIGPNADTTGDAGLLINSSQISSFGAESLLIGGIRTVGSNGTTITVTTGNITVDNAGAPLSGPDVILAATGNITLKANAAVEQSGNSTGLDTTLIVGNSTPGSADGVLLRVTSDPSAALIRSGVDSSTLPDIAIGAGARVSGVSVTLDSTSGASLDATAVLSGQVVNLGSGQISLQLDPSVAVPANSGLVLSSGVLAAVETSAKALSLLSYSYLDTYGAGNVGSASFSSLALHFSEMRGFDTGGGTVTFSAQNILLDNSPIGDFRTSGATQAGTLEFDAGVIRIGVSQLNVDQTYNQLALQAGSQFNSNPAVYAPVEAQFNLNQYIDQFAQVTLNASGGLFLQGTILTPTQQIVLGATVTNVLSAQGNLTIAAPLITGATAANHEIFTTGLLTLQSPAGASSTLSGGLGVSLLLQAGNGITDNGNIVLPSGVVTLHATGGNVVFGNSPAAQARLNVAGTTREFFDAVQYTDGGTVTLTADAGNVEAGSYGVISVSAPSGGGNAGSLNVNALSNIVIAASSVGSPAVTLASATLPPGFGVGSNLLGSTVQSINGTAVTLAAGANASVGAPTEEAFSWPSGNIALAASSTGSPAVTLASATLPPGFGVGSSLLGSTVQSINGTAVTLAAGANSTIGVSTQEAFSGGGGIFTVDPGGQLLGQGGAGGQNGTFTLNVGSIPGGFLSPLLTLLNAGGFTNSISIRDRNDTDTLDAKGNVVTPALTVDGMVTALSFNLSSDSGSIMVAATGGINAAGNTGGTIDLVAHDNLIIQGAAGGLSGAVLTVVGNYYDDAGQGGSVTLEAGAETNGSYVAATPNGNNFNGQGYLDIQAGSQIDLGVNHQLTTSDLTLGNTTDNRTDLFTGTLHLRAPMTAAGTDVQINPVNGTISNASNIVVEGYKFYTPAGGSIDSVENAILTDGQALVGVAGSAAAGYSKMQSRLFSANLNSAALLPIALIEPGAEIINTAGDLTLSNDWDLSTYRFGPLSAPGVLTLRAAGNLVFNGALSDGFTSLGSPFSPTPLYQYVLMDSNPLLPANAQSWSYRITAGADFSAADYTKVDPMAALAPGSGSVEIGQLHGENIDPNGGDAALLSDVITGFYQVIRTGAGNIDINAGRDVQLLNEFATIYTAGTQADPMANFDVPQLYSDPNGIYSLYPAQYSLGGGNVSISAQGNIVHLTNATVTINGIAQTVIQDYSGRELPMNWLYRRGYVDSTGNFGSSIWGVGGAAGTGQDIASTTWWVDFSNFFEGVGALGGGNVTMTAGQDIRNVDAVIPTNARMPGYDLLGNPAAPNAANLLELGGGDLSLHAGINISGGVYYVERGNGTLTAGNCILTNSTRAPYPTNMFNILLNFNSLTWLPTTLFVGKGSFDVSSQGDLLMGPAVNPFFLPDGAGDSYWYKTYFSTYAATDSVQLSSLTGDVTLREGVISPIAPVSSPVPILQEWMQYASFYSPSYQTAAYYQPWLRLNEGDLSPFTTVLSLSPPSLQAVSFSGNINIEGTLTLAPSPTGNLDLLAAGSVNGLQPVGSTGNTVWSAGVINLSDANPASIFGITTPFATQVLTGEDTNAPLNTPQDFLASIDNMFAETGATSGKEAVSQVQEALHTPGLLHANDSQPVQIYAGDGSISGLTLYSAKFSDVIAGNDITDIAFYIQNNSPSDVSLVSAGRDIILYDPASPLRALAADANSGNKLSNGSSTPLPGDIQIGGLGTLEVFAGRNLDLGAGLSNTNNNGTGLGILTIGDARNPYLPNTGGADIIAGAGMDTAVGLVGSPLDFTSFIAQFISDPANGARYLPDLRETGGPSLTPQSFSMLSPEEQDIVALQVFYLVLRDAGRDHNNTSSPGFGNYNAGFAAISALLPGSWSGDIDLTSREIKTVNGGNITLLAPGGKLTLGSYPVQQLVQKLNTRTNKLQLVVVPGNSASDMGIVTQFGGNIDIYTHGNVDIGTQRIFTLRGGNEIIWSSDGNIAAGASSKTVQSAPPTQVLVDTQSADVKTDLAGLATGGGIGVLESVKGVPPGNVDLIAPVGTIDAGDAGIRVSGNLNISAAVVLNTSNISVGGASAGTPPPPTAANVVGLTSTSNTAAASNSASNEMAKQRAENQGGTQQDVPSVITVEVLGYGGGDSAQGNPPGTDTPGANVATPKSARNTLQQPVDQSEPPLALNTGNE